MNFTRLNAKIDRINQLILEKENVMKELNNEIKNLKDGKKEIESYMRKYADAEAKEQELLKKYEDIDAEKKSKRTSKKRCNSHKSETLIQNNVTEKQSDKLKSETIENDLKYFNR